MHRIYSKAELLILKLIEGDRSMENNQRRERMCAKTVRSQPSWKVNWSDLLPYWILSGQNWNPNIANSKIPLQRCAFSHINQLTSSAREPEVICASQTGQPFSLISISFWWMMCAVQFQASWWWQEGVPHPLFSQMYLFSFSNECLGTLLDIWPYNLMKLGTERHNTSDAIERLV